MTTSAPGGLPAFYRPDIDGLRAVAVLSVVVFHFNASVIPGGFAGVDIFFVISGYLITSIMVRECGAGTFSILNFYARRVRRIIPALAVVVMATLGAGQFILLPTDLKDLSWSAIASILSVANVYFTYFLDSGYFAEDSHTKPLLHIWSLGVEEQFYLVWPAVILFMFAMLRTPVTRFAAAIAATVALVLLSEYLTRRDPAFAYYMIPGRAFELAIGACLALLPLSISVPPRRLGVGLSVAGLLLMGWSFVAIDETVLFPGFNALFATLGAAAIIYGGSVPGNVVSVLLGSRPMLFFGLISYSLYLWHWPVLAYLRYAFNEIDLVSATVAAAFMLVASVATHRFVEVPFRKATLPPMPTFRRHFLLPFAFIAAVSSAFLLTGGLGLYKVQPDYSKQIAELRAVGRPSNTFRQVCHKGVLVAADLTRAECAVNSTGAAPRVLLWGDSNAAHYVGMLSEFANAGGFSFRNASHSACPPLAKGDEFVFRSRAAACRRSIRLVVGEIANFDTIILAGQWLTYARAYAGFMAAVETHVTTLARSGKKVILLGQAPVMANFDRRCDQKAVKLPFLDCLERTKFSAGQEPQANRRLRDMAERIPGVSYFDPGSGICQDGVCSPYIDGRLSYYNTTHLSMEGSLALGRVLLASGGVPEPFRSLGRTGQ